MPLTREQLRRAQQNARSATLRELRRATRRLGVELVKPKDGGYVGEHAAGTEVFTVLLVPPGVDFRRVSLGDVFGDRALALAKAYEMAQAWLSESRRISEQASAAALFLLHSRKPEYLAPVRLELLSVFQRRADRIEGLSPLEVRAIDVVRDLNQYDPHELAKYRAIKRELGIPEKECRALIDSLIARGLLHDADGSDS